MIISRTPYRISFFGGGTDYPTWYREHGGVVLGTTIDKYCYLSVRRLPPFFQHKSRVVYARVELPNSVEEIQHPSVRAVLQEMNFHEGIEIHHNGDLPARSGMGSSSSFTVGLLNAMRALKGQISAPNHLACEAIRIEQEVIGEKVGSQDQVWAAFGGTNMIHFKPSGEFEVSPVIMPARRHGQLNRHLLLFFTGLSRTACEIAAKKIDNLKNRANHLKAMTDIAFDAVKILQDPKKDILELGSLFQATWELKRGLADCVSTSRIDEMYQAGVRAGAMGGKLLGAGGGGFLLFFAPPERHGKIREALKDLIEVTFKTGSCGSKIVMYEPSGLENL